VIVELPICAISIEGRHNTYSEYLFEMMTNTLRSKSPTEYMCTLILHLQGDVDLQHD